MLKADAINFYRTGEKLAEALGITAQAVYQWGEMVPREKALELERMTKGKLQAGARPPRKSRPSAA